MKKAFILLLLPLTALLCSAATDTRSAYYAGYRIGDSDVITEARITPRDWSVYNSGPVEVVKLEANKVAGQKIARWWAYRTMDYTGYIDIVNLASDVYSFDWTYDTASYSPARVVVDYDYIKYNLSYNANGGSGSFPTQNNIIYTNAVAISDNQPSRTGYTWSGWTNNLTTTVWHCGDAVTGESLGLRSIVNGSNVVLYAKWEVNSYTVTLDQQGGSGGAESVTATYGAAMPATNMPTRTGYTFGGYYTEENGKGTQYYNANGGSARDYNLTTETNLFAKWTANMCTVTFDKQEGTGGTSSVRATYDSAMPSATMPTRAGYTFGGYYTEANGSGTQYYSAGGESVNVWKELTDTTLYAKWEPNNRTIGLDWQGGSGGDASVNVTYGAPMPQAKMPARTGYIFDGYYFFKNGGGDKYYNADGSSARNWDKDADNLQLYANWRPNQYVVTLDQQEGVGGVASVTVEYEKEMPQLQEVPERPGYAFGGYYTAAGGDGTQYYASNGTSARKWDMTASTTLYAKWTAMKYTVTLDRQGGTGGSASVSATYDDAMPSATMPTRTGYTFGGYYDEENGGGTQYYTQNGDGVNEQNWNKASDATLYAKWTANTYTITFDQQSGTGGSTSVTATYDSAMPSATMPTRTGYTFGGYFTAKNGGGTQYYTEAGESVRNWDKTAATILYAKWTANKYTVTLDRQGGSGGTNTVSATFDSAMPSIAGKLPSRIGYTFGGYYAEVGGGGTQYYTQNGYGVNGQNWDKASDATLYAKWTTNTYNVAFNKNSSYAVGNMDNELFAYDEERALTSNAFSRTGYSFAGWATNQSGTAVYEDGQIVSNLTAQANGTIYIYATWTPKTYAVTLNANGGAVDPTSVDVTYDDAWPTLPTPTLDGYAFAGWYDDAEFKNATRTNYNVAVTNNTTIYANWTAKTYNVSFDKNSTEAAGNMQNEGFAYGEEKALTSNAFARVGYTFAGWATSADGQVEYTDGQIVSNLTTAASDVVPLFAAWTPIEYTIAFNGIEADNPDAMVDDSIPVAYDAVVILPESKFVKQGQSFKSWWFGDATYEVGASVSNLTTKAGATVTFLAVWSELRYVAFDGNGADDTGAMIDDVITFDGVETKNLIPNRFEKTGYTFGGWATNETDAAALNAAYTDGADVVSTNLWMGAGATNVFYAVWQTNTYVVVFEPNGGRESMMNQWFVYDQPQQLNTCDFVANLNFAGWATNSTGEIVFTNNETVVNLTAEANGTVTLYAVWDNGDLSKAMHCDNLVWETKWTGTEWVPITGPSEGYAQSGSAVSNGVFYTDDMVNTRSRKLKVHSSQPETKPGKLSFWYKTSCDDSSYYSLKFIEKEIAFSPVWKEYGPVDVSDIRDVVIILEQVDYNNGDGCSVWIDQMTWVPDRVEPTEDDMPTINGFTATVDGFTLSVDDGNISDSFSYQILATNELVSGDWPVKTNLTAEAIKAGYDIVPEANEPKMFYKVKVISK